MYQLPLKRKWSETFAYTNNITVTIYYSQNYIGKVREENLASNFSKTTTYFIKVVKLPFLSFDLFKHDPEFVDLISPMSHYYLL